ncbi:MAG: hypothetical protein FWE62_05955 [Firmicutes bacterium]|nr:hypothetical protein [Bacillota bacterium]
MWKYFIEAHKYLARTFLLAGWISIIGAVLLGLISSPVAGLMFIWQYKNTAITGFASVRAALFGGAGILLWLLCFVVVTTVAAVILGFFERNMRFGIRNFSRPGERFNETFFAVFPPFAIGAAMLLVSSYIETSVVLLAHSIFAGIGNTPGVGAYFAVVIIVLFFSAVKVFVVSSLLLSPPSYLIVGYKVTESFLYSLRLYQLAQFKLFILTAAPFVFTFLIESVFYFLRVNTRVVNMLCYVYIMSYLCSLAMVVYFDLTGTERKDIKPKFPFR